MAVITVSRESGSGGTYIAEKAAEALGYHFADKTAAAAVMEEYGFSRYEEEYESRSGFRLDFVRTGQERPDLRPMVDVLPQVSQALAHHGDVVILGRGSFAVLGGLTDVLNVRIQAPFGVRVRWFMNQENITEGEAQKLVRERDQVRAAFVRSWYGVRVDDISLFDLVIDTGKIPQDKAVDWLVESARLLEAGKGGGGRTAKNIQVNPAMGRLVSQYLKCEIDHA
jgi:cytidylate kinase